MRIIYDYRIFSLQRFGGISRYFLELIQNISNIGNNEIFFFAGLHISDYGVKNVGKGLTKFWGVRRPYFKKSLNIFYKINTCLFNWFLNKQELNTSNTIYHPTYYSKDIKKISSRFKTVVTIYDMIHERFPDDFPKVDIEISNKKTSIDYSHRIICISESTKKDLCDRYGIDPSKAVVIYPGPTLRIKDRTIKPYRYGRPYILYVGKRSGYKNFKTLLTSFHSGGFYKDFDLICFGGGDFSKKELKDLKELELSKVVRLAKGNDMTLVSLYKGAMCLIYPSLYEGFGMPILEAMNYRCPVITANTSSLPEVAGKAAIYFKPLDKEGLVSALQKLLEDKTLRDKMIKAGTRQAQKFSWKENAKKTLALYKELF